MMKTELPMKIRRDFDAVAINRVLNDPEVRPWVADLGEGVLDLSKAVANQQNVLLMGEHGGCMFYRMMDGMYEVHTQVLPSGRGQWVKDFLLAVRHYMWTRTDAVEVMTRVPMGHEGAKRAAEYVGMKYEFSRPDNCKFRGEVVGVDIYSVRIQDWVGTAPFLEDKGEWLHEQMEKEAHRVGITVPTHDNDPNHNRYVGATLEMFRGGQYPKAIAFYNRWVYASRHAQKGKFSFISMASISPPAINFDEGVLQLNGDEIQILPNINTSLRRVV